MRAPAQLRRAALGWRRRLRRPPGTSMCAGPRAAASRPHPRPGRQVPGAGRSREGPGSGRCAGAWRDRRLGPGPPGPDESAPPSPPPAPQRSRGRASHRRCSRCRFSATHRRDPSAGQLRRPPACRRCTQPELRTAPPAARLHAPTAPRAPRRRPQGFPNCPPNHAAAWQASARASPKCALPRSGPRALSSWRRADDVWVGP